MIVHLIDGTYELFRHFYGLRRFTKGEDPPFGAERMGDTKLVARRARYFGQPACGKPGVIFNAF